MWADKPEKTEDRPSPHFPAMLRVTFSELLCYSLSSPGGSGMSWLTLGWPILSNSFAVLNAWNGSKCEKRAGKIFVDSKFLKCIIFSDFEPRCSKLAEARLSGFNKANKNRLVLGKKLNSKSQNGVLWFQKQRLLPRKQSFRFP